MKFNWGTGIFLFYSLFAGMLVFQVIKSTQYDHSLVVDEYYKEDLAYQAKYDRIQNSMNLPEPLRIEYDQEKELVLLFFPYPGEGITGEVLFYRPSTMDLDIQFGLQVDADGKMLIPTKLLTSGRWKVEVNWTFQDTQYYDEKAVDLIGTKVLAGTPER
ncbi:MAG: FixH family protein [Saprospiraceae bacterium]|nr:FixH family protein [Saprospiraceae bacterium]